MNDQQRIGPGVQANPTGAEDHDLRDWADNCLRRAIAAETVFKALFDCDPADRLDFIEAAHSVFCAGWPGASFGRLMKYAASWADMATRAEHKAYALVCYQRMTPWDRRQFKAYISEMPDE